MSYGEATNSLLDDLQSSVGRVNGPNGHLGHIHSSANSAGATMSTTGYREVSRTMTTQATGQLPSTTREYQIEYLSPANSTTVPEERAPSPGVFNSSSDYSSGLDRHGNATSAYKTMSYEYKASTGSSNAALLRETADTLSQARAITDLGQSNIAELDTLLDDLNSAQRAGFNREYQITTTTSRDGYQPLPVQHISRSAQRSSQRSYSEQRYGSVNKDRQSPSPGPARHIGSSSLDRGLTSANSREVYSSSSRTTSPSPARRDIPPSPSAGRHIVEHNVYRSYDSRTGGGSSSTSTTTRYRDASPPRDRVRPPSPGLPPGVGLPDYPVTGAAKVSTLVREYERRASREEREASLTRRSPSPARSPVPRRKMMTSSTTYNYSSTSTSGGGVGGPRPEQPRTPPPHRSPSPVSFPQPPEPLSGYSYRRDEMSSYQNTRQRSRSRSPPPQPFPTGPVRTVYQVDRVERVQREPVLQPRPFPTPSPTTPPGDQRPPKELNELMSSFTETDMGHVSVRQHALDLEQRAQRQQPQAQPAPPTPPPARREEQLVSRNVAGPPVYYPPGVEMFQTREESHAQSAGGGYKGKAKAKYEYKMKQRSKESSKTGKAVVPVCLPLCCAMPCTIM
ncbi:Voltage-dependent calcium channel type A subunit alpha-1 [Frankliniella fusca]|uniref:Voltage-dependent calcium channel type A subunit alpha-1 n=1 Tax=Frankliniella fusca TaxID=407009 RepID=A0AAE1HFZ7_9NEOP|nr:Voltage-dependent calcium channel type A subunit alpha-1 [Frankliniella fusca]